MEPKTLKLSFADALRGKTPESPPSNEKTVANEKVASPASAYSSAIDQSSPNTSTSSNASAIVSSESSSTNSSFIKKSAECELLQEIAVASMTKCNICLGKLEDARILSCLHTFCKPCIEKLIAPDMMLGKQPLLVECPTCKQMTKIGANGVDSLVCDYINSNLIDLSLLSAEDTNEQIPCTSCKSKTASISHCKTCDNFLCSGCDNAHKYMRCFENHQVVRFDSIAKTNEGVQSCTEFIVHKPILCKLHPHMHFEYYCYHCQTPLCGICMKATHSSPSSDHRCEDINLAWKTMFDDINNVTILSEQKIEKCKNAILQQAAAQTKLLAQHNEAKNLITETTAQLKNELDVICESTICQLERLYAGRDLQLIREQQLFKTTLRRLVEAYEFSENVRNKANIIEFLFMKPLISSQMMNLIAKTPTNLSQYKILFKTDPNNYKKHLRAALGELYTEQNPSQFRFEEQACRPAANVMGMDNLQVSNFVSHCLAQIRAQSENELRLQKDNLQQQKQQNQRPFDDFVHIAAPNEQAVELETSSAHGPTVNNITNNMRPKELTTNSKALCLKVLHNFGSLGTRKGHLNSPHGFCLGAKNEIVVADTNNHRIVVYEQDGHHKFQFGIAGKAPGELWYPRKIALMPKCGKYVICDRGGDRSRMQIFTDSGHFAFGIFIRYIDIVAGLAVSHKDEIVAVDSVSPTIFIISPDGNLQRWFDCSNYMCEPSDIAIIDDHLYVCDFKGHGVVVFNQDGTFVHRLGHEKVTCFPNGIEIVPPGDIYICDSHGNRFHVACYTMNGDLKSEYECPQVRISRCCGLKVSTEGNLITLAKNNHHVLVMGAEEPDSQTTF